MVRVLLDCDGVLADFASGFLQIVNEHFGTSYTPADWGQLIEIIRAVRQ